MKTIKTVTITITDYGFGFVGTDTVVKTMWVNDKEVTSFTTPSFGQKPTAMMILAEKRGKLSNVVHEAGMIHHIYTFTTVR